MPLLQNELARWKNGQLELRPEPLRVRWTFDELVTADGHALRCVFTCSALGLADPTERRMLQEVLLQGRTSVTDQDLANHFTRALKAAAETVAEGQAVSHLLGEDGKRALCDALRAAGKPVAFACGVELLPPFDVETESPTLRQQRQRAVQRSLAEQATAAQVEHMQRAGELLKQFQEMRKAEGGASAGAALQQINPADRGSVLQKLLLASASRGGRDSRDGRAAELFAVAGPYLVKIGPVEEGGGPPRTQLVPLPPTLGPLRSVQGAEVDGQAVLLVGAQTGFFVVPREREHASEAVAYADPGIQSQLGFSRVVYWEERKRFVGCHGEGGLVQWELGQTDPPALALRADFWRVPGEGNGNGNATGYGAGNGAGAGGATAGAGASGAGQLSTAASTAFSYGGTATLASIGGAGAAARPAGPRNVQVVDRDRMLFSVGPRLVVWNGVTGTMQPPERTADVVAIVPEETRLHVVHEDGTVATLDRSTLEPVTTQRRAGKVRAAGALPWLGEVRLLLASNDGPVHCVGTDDSLVTHYASPYQGLRTVTGSAALVAGLSADRQRLVLWNSWDGRKPAAELHLAGIARHRAADVTFA